MTRILLSLLLLLVIGLSCGCDLLEGNKTSDDDLNVLLHDEFLELQDGRREVVIVDVRTAADYAAGHLPGAINIPVIDLRQGDPRLGSSHVVVYSDGFASGDQDLVSWAAAKKLLTLGYRNVYDYRGGVAAWEAHGGGLVQE